MNDPSGFGSIHDALGGTELTRAVEIERLMLQQTQPGVLDPALPVEDIRTPRTRFLHNLTDLLVLLAVPSVIAGAILLWLALG